MMKAPLLKTLLLAVLTAGISACTIIPKKLQLPEGTKLISFSEVKTASESNNYVGKQARWGGTIAAVKNLKDKTLIEVVHFPLQASTKPKAKNETLGRFRIYYSGLLDPIIYKQGMSVTAVGKIATNEKGKIGEHEYLFPVLTADNIYLWKQQTNVHVRVEADPFGYDYMGWPYHSRYYRPFTRIGIHSNIKAPVKQSKSQKQNKD